MDRTKERSVRRKIVDLQIFLGSDRCSDSALEQIDERLEHVLDATKEKKEVGGGAS